AIRKVENGVSPELEMGRFFARKVSRVRVPRLAGALEYWREGREPATLAILQKYAANQGDAWSYTLDRLRGYFEGVRAGRDLDPPPSVSVLELSAREPTKRAQQAIGDYLDSARLLGRRTAELHRALGSGAGHPSFVPESLSPAYRRSLHRSLQAHTARIFSQLRERLHELPPRVGADGARVLAEESEIVRRFRAIRGDHRLGRRLRCHGDYHLGQVLCTGSDFVIIDFEGEPARPLRERREKHSPLRDVAGMLRSFDYAVYAALGAEPAPDFPRLEPAARSFRDFSSAAFLRGYLDAAHSRNFLPPSRSELSFLLDLMILEKAIYEMGYEINHRPDWLGIPVRAVLEALDPQRRRGATSPVAASSIDGERK
ncbi:MAG TPA: alpha-amylase, partial [Vicinamibacteria bacterium]|nr:alpha-amylase [Vicinamibacteria bacterium]